ncbi:MAG: hypothetical protein IAF38_14400, partial [Bacteroidia bacterium]|nr:hypothetical protein [Bacteroidia bacterium]
MKNRGLYFLILVVAGFILSDCTNKKNTFITRGFHNLTSHYNGFYWATESIKDGVYKIETGYKEDYSKTLPLFIYPDNSSSKTIYPEMDKAIKKSSLVIQRHAIIDKKTKKEVYGAVKWIDDNWLVVGKAHFYKREFFSGVEIFEFVSKSYKGKQKYEAMLWLIRTYNEIGTLSQSEPIIAQLRNDKNLPKELKKDLSSVIAEFYVKQGLWDEAAKELENTVSLTKNRKQKARFHFILGQISESKKDQKSAIMHYNKCIALKPNYDMIFNAKIKKARLYDIKDQRIKGIKQELLKMAKDPKNDEYLDVIYYTLGEMEEKEKNVNQAMAYFKKSVKTSVNNTNQKALSYLKLADNSFEKTHYVDAGNYYDSAVAVLDKKHPDYDAIVNKQKNLNALISNLNIIHEQDSFLMVAGMDSTQRNALIAKIIKKIEDDELKKKEQEEAIKNGGVDPFGTVTTPTVAVNGGEWYFYNQSTKSFGINEFVKKFGNRKLEDNWRRSNKQSNAIDPIEDGQKDEDTTGGKTVSIPKVNDKKKKEFYLQGLPFTDEAKAKSNEKILEAFYQLGSIYREALNNRPKAMAAFDEMNKRFPKNKYECNTYYQGHRMASSEKDNARKEKYYNALKSNCPESDYFKILNDSDFVKKGLQNKNQVEQFYTATYNLYTEAKYREALDRSNESLKKDGKSDYSGRFALLRAMCIGRLSGPDSMERALTSVIVNFAGDPVKVKAQELLDYLKAKKGGGTANTTTQAEIYSVNPNVDHFWVCLLPKDFKGENSFKTKLSDYSTEYFGPSNLEATSIVYGDQTLIFVKKFTNKELAMNYATGVYEYDKPFSGSNLNK